MAETERTPELLAKKTSVEAFITALQASAKTAGLYKPGHPTIMAIAERTVNLLNKTLGQETTLSLEIAAKTVLVDEAELPESPEVVAFAVALHTLGVGQVLFTNRVTKEGMLQFFGVLNAKADDKTTLTDLQKTVQQVRIDGLQLIFILSFVVTGETEVKDQKPGQLSEEQIAAFVKAETTADYLSLLLHQNEDLAGKDAEAVTNLLDDVLYRDVSVEKFEQEMAWSFYDPRIRKRWDELRTAMDWEPKLGRAGQQRWSRRGAASWAALVDEKELAQFHSHQTHSEKDSLLHALAKAHAVLDAPVGPAQPKYAIFAYTRLLSDLGRFGGVAQFLAEGERWRALEKRPEYEKVFPILRADIQHKVLSSAIVEQLAAYVGSIEPVSPEFERVREFALFCGPRVMPLFIDELHRVTDKTQRQKMCQLLLSLAKPLGDKAVVAALKDEDWLVVTSMIGILVGLENPAYVDEIAPLMKHGNRKVREAVAKVLSKFGGQAAVDALADFAARGEHEDEVAKAVISLSQINLPGVDAKIIALYRKTKNYHAQVAAVRALSRFPTRDSIALLKEAARRTWYEILSGMNKELRTAAKHSLEELHKEAKA